MRIFLILISLLLCTPNLVEAQPRYINKFINKHKNKHDAFAFTFPGWLIKKGAKIAIKSTEGDDDATEALKLLNHVKKMRMMVIEENSTIEEGEIRNLMMKMKNDSFEDYLIVRDKEARVNFMAKEKNNVIKEMFFLVNDGDTFLLMTMKTNITVEQFDDLDLEFLEEEDTEEVTPVVL